MDVEVETQMRVAEEHERPGAQLASTGVIPSLVHDAPTPPQVACPVVPAGLTPHARFPRHILVVVHTSANPPTQTPGVVLVGSVTLHEPKSHSDGWRQVDPANPQKKAEPAAEVTLVQVLAIGVSPGALSASHTLWFAVAGLTVEVQG